MRVVLHTHLRELVQRGQLSIGGAKATVRSGSRRETVYTEGACGGLGGGELIGLCGIGPSGLDIAVSRRRQAVIARRCSARESVEVTRRGRASSFINRGLGYAATIHPFAISRISRS